MKLFATDTKIKFQKCTK